MNLAAIAPSAAITPARMVLVVDPAMMTTVRCDVQSRGHDVVLASMRK
ncbi:MAG: hypothetical protein ACR2OU_09300 [Thermomicrobiales bacterium]